MPDKNDFLDGAKALEGTNTGYDPSLTKSLLDNFAANADKTAATFTPSSTVGGGNSFGGNANYNFTDQSTISSNQEATQGLFHDFYNDFWQSYHSTAQSTIRGKMEYSMFGTNNEGPQAIIDDYPDRLADLNQRLGKGLISQVEFSQKKSDLDMSLSKASTDIQKSQAEIDDEQRKIDENPVSKGYKARQQYANLAGDAASIFDKAYSLSSTVGSSASLMLPTFMATFGNKLTKNLAKVAVTNVLPGIGEGADLIAGVVALGSSIAELVWSRSQESYGEVDQAIQDSRKSLVSDYMAKHNIDNPNLIPDEDMRKIRQQSRQGAREQFNQNMALALLDVGEAVIMPLSNMGMGLSKLAKPFKFVEEALSDARNYNKFTRYAGTAVKFGMGAMGEKFEEGFQQAAQYRAADANKVWDKDFFTHGSLIKDILTDSYDVAASLDYSLIPGLTLRGNGKYSKDAEFQTAEESGGTLAMLMGGIPTALSVRSDFKAYKAATKDLMNKGFLNADDKFTSLRNSVLKKYFDKDQIQFLAGALKSITGKVDDQGNEIVPKEEITKLVKDIKHAYEVYQPLAEQVDGIAEDKFTMNPINVIMGSGFFKNSKKLAAAKEMLKEDIFNKATSIGARKDALAELETEKATLLAKEQNDFNSTPGVADAQKDLIAREAAIKDLLSIKGAPIQIDGKYIDWRKNILQEKLKQLEEFKEDNHDKLEFAPSKALQDIHEKIVANEMYLQDSQEHFNKLNKIRNAKQLYDYLGDNLKRPISPNSKLHDMLKDEDTNDLDMSEDTPAPDGSDAEIIDGTDDTTPEAVKDTEAPDLAVSAAVSTAPVAPAAPAPTTTSAPASGGVNDAVASLKKDLGAILGNTDRNERGSKLISFLSGMGLNLGKSPIDPLTTIMNGLKNVYTPAELDKLFPAIKDAVKVMFPQQKDYEYDPATGTMVTKQGVPPTQSSADDISNMNWDLMGKLNNNEEDPNGTGLKVVNSLSIAWVGLEGVQYEDGQWKDDRGEDGKLKFNETDDQQLNNTNAIKVGDELTIRAISDVSQVQDTDDLDQYEIGIYKQITIGGITREARIGYIPKTSSLEARLAETSDYQAEFDKLSALRSTIVSAGNGYEFKTTVTKKGFGFLNRNRATVLTTIASAIGDDTRPTISIIDDNGRPEKQGLEVRDIQGVGFKAGSTIVLLPNETNTGTEYLPMYVVKNKLSEDTAVLDRVTKQVEKFLETGAMTDLSAIVNEGGAKKFGAKAYMYITTSSGDLAELGKSGIFASTGGPAGINISVGDKIFRAGDHGLKEALANIYFSANKQLLKNPSYQSMMKKSKLLKTNISANPVLLSNHENGTYAFLKDNQEYQYFNQHTIEFAPVAETQKVAASEDVEELPTTKDIDEKLEELGIDLDFDDLTADDINTEGLGIRDRILVNPKSINASLQTQMVDSVAYKMLTSSKEADDPTTNKDRVKAELEKIKHAIDTKYELSPDKTTKQALNAKSASDKFGLLLDNYDAIVEKSKELLVTLGFESEDGTDYYDALEASEEDERDTVVQENASNKDPKKFLPSDVKKLIYFIPKLVMLGNSEQDRELAEKTGKDYKPAANELGLPTFNNFTDTWEKVLAVTSSGFFDSSKSGFEAMLTKLQDEENPPVVKELAKKLETASTQTKKAFFSRTYLQEQKNMTFIHSVTDFVQKFFDGIKDVKRKIERKAGSVIRSDRSHAFKKVEEALYSEFVRSTSGIIVTRHDSVLGKDMYYVDSNKAKELRDQINAILADSGSFKPIRGKGNIKDRPSDSFDAFAKVSLYNIVREGGFNITFKAFNDLLKYYKSTSEAKGERVAMQEIFANRIFKTMVAESKESLKTPDGLIEFSKANPFVSDSSDISSIAKQEYKYRRDWGSGSYRASDGKSYYAYTKHNYLSEIFLQIKQGIANKTWEFVQEKFNKDNFAKHSLWIEKILNPADKDFKKLFDLMYLLDVNNKQSDLANKQLKDMTPREHLITRLGVFQNQGARSCILLMDTMSDKTTKPAIKVERHDVVYGYDKQGKIMVTGNTLDTLYRYFEAEYDRIQQTVADNETFGKAENKMSHKLIKGYHDIGTSEGMGKYFNIYYFLNKAFLDDENVDLSQRLYESNGTLKPVDDAAMILIKDAIASHMSKVIANMAKQFKDNDLYTFGQNPKTGKMDVDLTAIAERDYLYKEKNEFCVLNRLKIPINRDTKVGNFEDLAPKDIKRIINHIIVDYTINSIIGSNEMLMLTGDPAQAGKLADKNTVANIKDKYKENPLKANKYSLLAHIQSTFVNVSKRNAAFLASGERYSFDSDKYNVAIANDMKIESEHLEEYKAMFPGNVGGVTKAYSGGDLTDAQEVTTVQEHLHVMKAAGKITEEQYRKALYVYDPTAHNAEFSNAPTISDDDMKKVKEIVMQPMKPVQRTFLIDNDSKLSKQFYIKTSSYPLIPSMVEGTPLGEMLREMRHNNVQRVAFVSGVKQGVAGSKNLLIKNEEGGHDFNKSFFENNINELPRSGFRIQLEVPYKEAKDHIREGTQQSKLLFVDIPDDLTVDFKGTQTSISDLKAKYIDFHRKIVDLHTQQLLKEITNRVTGKVDLKKLSGILQEEGLGKGYALNSLLGLDINKKGQFKIPLTFLPNAGQIEPVVTAIVSNRIAKLKMPGKSYIQGAEFVLKMRGKKGSVEEGTNLDKRSIIWTKPEYQGLSKLGYLTGDKPAQIVMPFYFIKDGVKLSVEDYIDKTTGLLDASRIDPELLQMNGFRIPFQGHNSGMWFEVVGFLPSEAGDLVLVPGEIAGQMGSDYDVDKLYAYMYNYFHNQEEAEGTEKTQTVERFGADNAEWLSLKAKTQSKLKESGVEPIEGDFYAKEDFNKALGEVVKEAYPDGNVPKHTFDKVTKESKTPARKGKYEINKVDSDTPGTVEELQNAIIDAQKSIYTSKDPEILKAILDPLSFDDFKNAIDEQGSEENSDFMGAFDPGYQMDNYFSNVTGKFGTAVGANANTSHAMAQTANLYVKGEGVMFLDENGDVYSDYIHGEDKNRINKLSTSTYEYTKKEAGEIDRINQNHKSNNSAWRFDKVYTFDINPKTGKPYRISNLISQVLGIAVDNAKEQLLGAFGINQLNLSVMLTITRAGFGFRYSKAFINQPILKEYYKLIGETEDIYDVNFTPNKRQAAIDSLYKKYKDQFKLQTDIQGREGISGFKLSELEANLGRKDDAINEGNVELQLEVLKAYLRYKDISDAIQAVSSAFNVDSKGLPKNMSETARKAESIAAILGNDSSEENAVSDILGNVDKYVQTTIPGLFVGVPRRVVSLFMDPLKPIFGYATAAYQNAKTSILYAIGKEKMYDDQLNTIHNHIKQYIYSGFDIDKVGMSNLSTHVKEERERLLFDSGETESLQTRTLTLKALYPNNDLISSIDVAVSKTANDTVSVAAADAPRLIDIQMSNEDDYIQKMSEHWGNMLEDNSMPDLQAFAKDLVKYALWVNPQEFGPSNIIKYIPFSYLEKLGFGDYLNNVNEHLSSEEDPLQGFVDQFLRHNEDFLSSVREKNKEKEDIFVPKSAIWEQEVVVGAGGATTARNKVLDTFKLPKIDAANLKDNKAVGLVRTDKSGKYWYPQYLKFYNNEVYKTQVYEGVENTEDGTWSYTRIGNLGQRNMSEYNLGAKPVSIIATNAVTVNKPSTDTVAVRNALGLVNKASNMTPTDTSFKYLKEGATPDDVLKGIIDTSNTIIANAAASKADKAYAGLYNYLATRLHNTGLNKVKIVFDSTRGVPGNTKQINGDITITFNPNLMSRGRTGLINELEVQRTVLHEFIHAKMFEEFGKTGRGSEDFKAVEAVWEQYKKAIGDGSELGQIRGIPVSVLDAELLNTLKQMFNENKSNDLATGGFSDFVKKVIADESLIDALLERTSKSLEKSSAKDKNTDLVSNKARRDEFKAHIKKEFIDPNALGDKINKYYAYHDINEFFTEALTNRKLQAILHATPSLWQSFVNTIKDILAKILGIGQSERTLFDDAFDSIFKYLKIAPETEVKTKVDGTVGSLTNPHQMSMNFVDGDGGRRMRPEFAGKSTMDLILSGDRTATSRDWSKPYNRMDIVKGDYVIFTDKQGRKALVQATTDFYPVIRYNAETWSKLEGWSSSRYNDLTKDYYQFQFKLVNQEVAKPTDTYQYYGAKYEIVRDTQGKAIDVSNFKGPYANKKKIMDAYNDNPDVDIQNGRYFRNDPGVVSPQTPISTSEQPLERQYTKPDGKVIYFNDQQFDALKQIKEWSEGVKGQFFTLAGYAGTGKTTIVNAAIKDLKRVAVSAPTHKAKRVIAKATGRPAVTIQSLLGLKPNTDIEDFDANNMQFDTFNEPQISKYRYVVLDEASMLNKDLFELLVAKAEESGTKIIFMGDPAQLPPVGEDISEVFTSEHIKNKAELTKVERQANGNPLMAVYDSIRNNLNAVIDAFSHKTQTKNGQGITFTAKALDFEDQAEAFFGSEAYRNDKNYVKILSWTNDGVNKWNKSIRKFLLGDNLRLTESGDTLTAYKGIMKEKKEILVNSADYSVTSVKETDNAYGIKVLRTTMTDVDDAKVTTTIDVVSPEPENMAKVKALLGKLYHDFDVLPKGKRGAAWAEYESVKSDHVFMSSFDLGSVSAKGKNVTIDKDIDYGYALTVHKSQGSTYTHSMVDEANIDKLSDRSFTDFLYGKERDKQAWKGNSERFNEKYKNADEFYRKKQIEKNKLKYVAFSRPTDTVFALSSKAQPATKKVVRGDLFAAGRTPVVTTNLEGVHGAGIAQLAKSKGLIKQGEGGFGGNKMAIRFPTKKTWREGADLDLMRESFTKFINMANKNKNFNFAFPLAGLGHGGGKVEDIVPMIADMLRRTDNVTLVIPNADTDLGKQASTMADKTKDNIPAVLDALANEGFIMSSDDISVYSVANETLGQLMNMGIITIYC